MSAPLDVVDGEISDFDSPRTRKENGDPAHSQSKYRKPVHPDNVRRTIAYGLMLLIFILSLSVCVLTAFGCFTLDEAKDIANAFITPIVSIFGTIVGFYYGSYAVSGK